MGESIGKQLLDLFVRADQSSLDAVDAELVDLKAKLVALQALRDVLVTRLGGESPGKGPAPARNETGATPLVEPPAASEHPSQAVLRLEVARLLSQHQTFPLRLRDIADKLNRSPLQVRPVITGHPWFAIPDGDFRKPIMLTEEGKAAVSSTA